MEAEAMTANDFMDELARYGSDSDAVFLQRFFKSGPGEYGEDDQFIGVRVPMTRRVCRQFKDLPLGEVKKLIDSPIHEHRLGGLIILTLQYPRADQAAKQQIFDLYIDSVYEGRVNNWDLVDVTTPSIVGPHLNDDRKLLYKLVRNDNLWQKRVAVMATFHYIKQADASTTLELAEILLHDKHDLIQKAVGWMLREVGKRVDQRLLLEFLDKHASVMPRTMLRYSIEHLNPEIRDHYMRLKHK